jgi:hypothetical protein
MRRIAWCIVLALIPSVASHAQREPRRGTGAFAIEAVGGTAGSLAGVGLGLAISRANDECGSEDLACQLRQAATTGTVSVIGATAGAFLAGRTATTEPSVAGSLLGAVAGAAAGVGVIHLLTEETKLARNNGTLVVAYSVTQGVVSALGSRIVAAVRR